MSIITLAQKDLRLLLRDTKSAVILFMMPVVMVVLLGLAVGEAFERDRLKISVLVLDEGIELEKGEFPGKLWAEVVLDDLTETAEIEIERLSSREEAEDLIQRSKRSAVLIFEPPFSRQMHRSSFLSIAKPEPFNPLDRDGIDFQNLGLTIRTDPTQPVAASVIEQAAQVSLIRVVIPWMIGKAFKRVGDKEFMDMMVPHLKEAKVTPEVLKELKVVIDESLQRMIKDKRFSEELRKENFVLSLGFENLKQQFQQTMPKVLDKLFQDHEFLKRLGEGLTFQQLVPPEVRNQVGPVVQSTIGDLFESYNFRATTWKELTKNREGGGKTTFRSPTKKGAGFLNRGALRYQILVPSYTVMFAFFLILTMGWLFVGERRQGTLTRLRAAPLKRSEILLGKLIPCLVISWFQGLFLLLAGKIVFGMSWGPQPLWLIPVVISTSFAAMGLALLVGGLSKTESQVAVFGTLLVLVLAIISGSLMPRDLMPEELRKISYITPHAWALDAYSQLLVNPEPAFIEVGKACLVLLGFGFGFLGLAWWLIRFD
jgi:ABC-2 type transport system permease protein